MSAVLEITAPGVFTTVQDLGRTGFLDIGVPPSGALDPVALRLANRLVGNDETEGALEILHAGPEFIVRAPTARIAYAGADCTIEILQPEPVVYPAGRSLTVVAGDRIRLGAMRASMCGYLAVAGGFAIEPCMNSLSTYVRGGFGGFQGRTVQAGDHLPLKRETAPVGPDLCVKFNPGGKTVASSQIRVILGPQDDHFSKAGLETLLTSEFVVSASSDRMGARLDGPQIELLAYENFISDGITAGAIQVPGSGQPIVLLADHQTTGGYPKIATVISADLPVLGRMRPGSRLRFSEIDVEAGEAVHRQYKTEIAKLVSRITPVTEVADIDIDELYSSNLISGVIDGEGEQE